MDLESAAAELYALPPGEFVARRGKLAKEAGASGQKELAEQIKRLSKPSGAAWAVNLLSTRRPSEFEEVARSGAAFRDAVAEGDAGALASLSAERRAVIHRAAESAFDLASTAVPEGSPGAQPSAATRADVEQTLQAVLADAGAAAAARTGRLVRGLTSTGVESVDLSNAVGGPFEPPKPDDAETEDTSESGAAAAKRPKATEHPRRASSAEAMAAKRVETAAQDAREELRAVDAQLDELSELQRRARDESGSLADEIDELQRQLDDITATLRERRRQFDDLEERLDETGREFGRLDRRREKAARLVETTERAAERATGRRSTDVGAPGAR